MIGYEIDSSLAEVYITTKVKLWPRLLQWRTSSIDERMT